MDNVMKRLTSILLGVAGVFAAVSFFVPYVTVEILGKTIDASLISDDAKDLGEANVVYMIVIVALFAAAVVLLELKKASMAKYFIIAAITLGATLFYQFVINTEIDSENFGIGIYLHILYVLIAIGAFVYLQLKGEK